jgi:hypothetical protein
MANILTQAEAQGALRLPIGESDSVLDLVLPAVDEYLKNATGYDWSSDATVNPLAKQAAIMLTVQWYENPAMIGTVDVMQFGVNNLIGQLTAMKLPAA